MDIRSLKSYVFENDLIPQVLEGLGCHHIQERPDCFRCANPDGDNPAAILVYKNESLTTVDYTREISGGRATADLISLVEFFKKLPFFKAVLWICQQVGLDYYADESDDLPKSLLITQLLKELSVGESSSQERPVRPISETILSYYKPWKNFLFLNDGISFEAQDDFEIGFDEFSQRITIPIRDELGTLVGVKGRRIEDAHTDDGMKYMYLEPTSRSRILFGLYKTYSYIQREGLVYVFESEKAVMQCWSAGVQNAVATGGKEVSGFQLEMLARLCVPVCWCFDQDVPQQELEALSERLSEQVTVYALVDKNGILGPKQSPSDDMKKFNLLRSQMVRLR